MESPMRARDASGAERSSAEGARSSGAIAARSVAIGDLDRGRGPRPRPSPTDRSHPYRIVSHPIPSVEWYRRVV